MAEKKITAGVLITALESRHSKDVFVAECNLGSAMQGCRRMDAWVMPRSWSPLKTIGYEVKVSRSDFLNDDKWYDYRPFVHEIWFACPWGLIDPGELPDGVGLLWLNTGGTLVRKKKAVRVEPDLAKMTRAMAYILMARSMVCNSSEDNVNGPMTAEAWQKWLTMDADSEHRHAHPEVLRQVHRVLNERCGKVASENSRLQCEEKRWDALSHKLRSIGLDPDELFSWNVEHKVAELRGAVPKGLLREMASTAEQLNTLIKTLENLGNG